VFFVVVDSQPTSSPTLSVLPGDYIYRECGGVLTKHIGSQVPTGVLDNVLAFQKDKFRQGYFAVQSEEQSTIVKVKLIS